MKFRKRYSIFALLILLLIGSLWKEALALMTPEEEKKLGKKILLEMEGKLGMVKDPTLQAFINKIGYSLVAQVGASPFEYKFYLVNSTDPNAYAIPGGHIFLTTGLIVLAENEHEVAGVISHEISHAQARHVAELIERSKRLNLATLAAIVAGILVGGGGKTSEAVTLTALSAGQALTLKYTREMEVDADHQSLNYMTKAGYDPNGLISFLNKIYKISLTSGPKIPAYLSTHPATENRISLLENLLQSGQKPKGPFKEILGFKKIKAKAFVEEREPNVAVTHFQSLIDQHPKELEGYYGLGLAFRKMGRLDKSTESFQEARSLNPRDPDVLRELGIVYFLSGKIDQAIEVLEAGRSFSSDPDHLALYYLGRGYQEKGNLEKALSLFLEVKKEIPDFVDIYLSIGSVYGRMGEKGLSHFYYGKHFKLKGDKTNALLHFRTALEWLERGMPEREEAQREIRELGRNG
ncbi:MAG: M48 family metalloprotease [Thermodesulfobacteriota bacterium]